MYHLMLDHTGRFRPFPQIGTMEKKHTHTSPIALKQSAFALVCIDISPYAYQCWTRYPVLSIVFGDNGSRALTLTVCICARQCTLVRALTQEENLPVTAVSTWRGFFFIYITRVHTPGVHVYMCICLW